MYYKRYEITFQFHYGSIKRTKVLHVTASSLCFNSTMVRLKDWKHCEEFISRGKYQFQLGAIKIILIPCKAIWLANFNSTMVRLKAWLDYAWPEFEHMFQFHYGSIKSRGKTAYDHSQTTFQFHFGSIKHVTCCTMTMP